MVEKSVLQCYCHYLKQIDPQFKDLSYDEDLVTTFFQLFDQKFNPNAIALCPSSQKDIPAALQEALERTVRTNAYIPERQALVIKCLWPNGLIDIFMDHPLFEASFLKRKPIARGGIRLSDRPDFRNECFQLMTTQVLKNTVIVPTGAKGAFFFKAATQDQALDVYKLFVHGLLDISDNLQDAKVIPPAFVRCYDNQDFYNVIAADKGTAYFSDAANAISQERGYWLGDAFASGGSTGYNHKALAITSRGVWICVRDHLGPWVTPLKVVGIGDMAGDIFGNGLLEEKNIQLLAAFNHQSIFIDPTPDLQKSYAQRKILFNKPGSQWEDYTDFSPGGMVASRFKGPITLTQEAQKLLGFQEPVQPPETIIQHILKLPADLLWMGGIGTFVKEENESDAIDPVNTSLRIHGHEVQAKVVGEGANLGFTFQGRVAYALKGGKINTDAIDNSAGVSCSDYEINLKILLNEIVRQGKITVQERNHLLQEMTQEVCTRVLMHNHWQSLILSMDQEDPALTPEIFADFFGFMDAQGVDLIPEAKQLKVNLNRKPTRPELALSLTYSKMLLREKLEKYPFEKTRYCEVESYFPDLLSTRFSGDIQNHLLYHPLKATILTNKIIYLFGPFILEKLYTVYGKNFNKVPEILVDFYQNYEGHLFFNKCNDYFNDKKYLKKILRSYRDIFDQWFQNFINANDENTASREGKFDTEKKKILDKLLDLFNKDLSVQ